MNLEIETKMPKSERLDFLIALQEFLNGQSNDYIVRIKTNCPIILEKGKVD